MRIEVDVAQLERNLAAYLAGRRGMTVDEDLFRGGIPDGVAEGLAVLVGQEKNTASRSVAIYELHTLARTFAMQVIGKFDDRDEAWAMATLLRDLFPVWNESMQDYTIVSLVPGGDSFVYPSADGGAVKHNLSVNLTICVVPKTGTP